MKVFVVLEIAANEVVGMHVYDSYTFAMECIDELEKENKGNDDYAIKWYERDVHHN